MASKASFHFIIINTRHTYTCSFSSLMIPKCYSNNYSWSIEIFYSSRISLGGIHSLQNCTGLCNPSETGRKQPGISTRLTPDWPKKTQRGEVTRQGQGQWLGKDRGLCAMGPLCCGRGPAASQEGRKWGVLWPGFGARKWESAGIRITEGYAWVLKVSSSHLLIREVISYQLAGKTSWRWCWDLNQLSLLHIHSSFCPLEMFSLAISFLAEVSKTEIRLWFLPLLFWIFLQSSFTHLLSLNSSWQREWGEWMCRNIPQFG